MTSTEFVVPIALTDAGVLVRPCDASKGSPYFCPVCSERLIVRGTERVVTHFSHLSNSNCSPETVLHRAAKLLVAEAIRRHNDPNDEAEIHMACVCRYCHSDFDYQIPAEAFDAAVVEKAFGQFVPDVTALKDGRAKLAIEVLVSHAVNEHKATSLNLPWVELRGEDVLDAPLSWKPVAGKPKPVSCSPCKQQLRLVREICVKWGLAEFSTPAMMGLQPGHPYLAAVETCFKCHEQIPVYWWSTVPFCDSMPSGPRPRTIKHVFSQQFGGKYWANTCPSCGVLQGDNHLFLGRSSLFSGLPLRQGKELTRERQRASKAIVNRFLRHI